MKTDLRGEFVLPEDLLLIPVQELVPSQRDRLAAAEGDVAITRLRARAPSSVVDENAARLLAMFRTPSTVVDAIVRFSEGTSADPRVVLESAFPMFERLVRNGVLVPSGDERAGAIQHTVQRGDVFGDFRVIDQVQVLEDVELHRVRSAAGTFGALKVARSTTDQKLLDRLTHEATVLRRLDGRAAPCLLAGDLDARPPYMVLSWCEGVPPTRAADELRAAGKSSRPALLALCAAIADAYADLHGAGILHGDVHDRNILVDRNGSATLVDFGLSVTGDDNGKVARGGIPAFHDPQLARAMIDKAPVPRLDAAAEQYSIGALLYLVATGSSYLELSMRRGDALRQIAEDPPLPFAARGVEAWPALERVLQQSLAKDPAHRFASLRDLATALRAVAIPMASADEPTSTVARREFIDTIVRRLEPGGELYTEGLPTAPLCSVNNGAAGIAYAMYRMASARENARLLANADAWITRAKAWSSETEAWYTRDNTHKKGSIGTIALYHTATGLHCVEALIALSIGDEPRAVKAAMAFIAASRKRNTNVDLTLGSAGLLAGAVLILESSPTRWPDLEKRAGEIAGKLERSIADYGAIDQVRNLASLGVAHGWSGLLWSLLRWYGASGVKPPAIVRTRLDELANLATPRGRGLAWAWSVDPRDLATEPHPSPTWCNGATGHLHTWLEAHAMYHEQKYLDLARAAAWNIWDDSRDAIADACCGLTGRAYAMMALHRRTGEQVWRDRAERLADRARAASSTDGGSAHRLYKGALGVALLLEELESSPDSARMPLFEAEGWNREWA